MSIRIWNIHIQTKMEMKMEGIRFYVTNKNINMVRDFGTKMNMKP